MRGFLMGLSCVKCWLCAGEGCAWLALAAALITPGGWTWLGPGQVCPGIWGGWAGPGPLPGPDRHHCPCGPGAAPGWLQGVLLSHSSPGEGFSPFIPSWVLHWHHCHLWGAAGTEFLCLTCSLSSFVFYFSFIVLSGAVSWWGIQEQ